MNKKNTLKAVFFDFGGTLMDSESDKVAHLHMMKEIKSQYQLSAKEEQLVDQYHTQLFNNDMTLKSHSQNDNVQFKQIHFYSEAAFCTLLKQFSIKITDSDRNWFNKIYLDNHLKYVQLVEGVWDVMDLVKKNDYHCGIISDIDEYYQVSQFQALNLTDAFHSITTSEEVRNYKPDPNIFRIALNKANCKGNEAIIIGDSYAKDIAGGKNMGMTTIWINRYQNHPGETNLADYIVSRFKEIIPVLNHLL